MRAVVSHGVRDFRLEEVPMPEVGEGDVLVEIHYCGICGTDVHQYHGHWELGVGQTPGHEVSGVVSEIGPGVARVKPGDRVALFPSIRCRVCEVCTSGRAHLCENRQAAWDYSRGGFTEYTCMPERVVYPLPEGLPLEWAALFEPCCGVVQAHDRAGIKAGQTVAVLGAGPIGLIHLQLALLHGAAKVFVCEPGEERRRVAEELGAAATIDPSAGDAVETVKNLSGGGVDVVIEAAGLPQTAAQCFPMVRRGGTIVQYGVCAPDARIEISPFEVMRKDLTIIGCLAIGDVFYRVLDLLATERLRVEPLISHVMGLSRFMDALTMHERHEALKILVTPRAND